MIITNLAEARKNQMITEFIDHFGSLPFPKCFQCSSPVQKMSLDAEPHENVMIITCECHGDKEVVRAPFNEAMKFKCIEINYAFHPKAHRENGMMVRNFLGGMIKRDPEREKNENTLV
tara:strand:+ start:261 stop:614 length:354 start_codon:yes stop_codon:yes gene_type:complete